MNGMDGSLVNQLVEVPNLDYLFVYICKSLIICRKSHLFAKSVLNVGCSSESVFSEVTTWWG